MMRISPNVVRWMPLDAPIGTLDGSKIASHLVSLMFLTKVLGPGKSFGSIHVIGEALVHVTTPSVADIPGD